MEVHELRGRRNAMEERREALSRRLWAASERLSELDGRLEAARAELADRLAASKDNGQAGVAGLASRALNSVLEEAVTSLLGPEAAAAASAGGATAGALAQGERDDAAREMLREACAATAELSKRHGPRAVVLHRVSPEEGVEERIKVTVTAELRFDELVRIALAFWGLDPHDVRCTHTLVDDAGTTWPSDANVLRDVCKGRVAHLHLDTAERFELSQKQQQQLLKLGERETQTVAGTAVAPLLGEAALKRHERALAGIGEPAPSRTLATKQQQAQRQAGKRRREVSSRRRLLDIASLCILAGIMLYHVIVEDVSAEREVTEGLNEPLTVTFLSRAGVPTSFANISTMQDALYFIGEPLQSWLDELLTDGSTGSKLVMPVRVRQSRVRREAREAPDSQCASTFPMLGMQELAPFCFPAYGEDTVARTFFEGNDLQAPDDPAFVFQSNLWTVPYRLAKPPEASADLSPLRGFGPDGYVLDLKGAQARNMSRGISSLGGWADRQTRMVAFEAVYYNADFSILVHVTLSFVRDASGALAPAWWANALQDLPRREAITLLALDVAAVLVLANIVRILVARWRATHAELETEAVVLAREERRRDLVRSVGAMYKPAQEERRRVPVSRVLVAFLWRFWTVLDLSIIALTLAVCILSTMARWCERFRSLEFHDQAAPGAETAPTNRFVTIAHLAEYTTTARIAASHVVFFVTIKLYGYFPYDLTHTIEFGTLYYSATAIAEHLLQLVILVLGTAGALFLLSRSHSPLVLRAFIDWASFLFGGDLTGMQSLSLAGVVVAVVALLATLYHIRMLVGILYQGKVTVSTEQMRRAAESNKAQRAGRDSELLSGLQRAVANSRVGRPNF